jgi:hypothetical protein
MIAVFPAAFFPRHHTSACPAPATAPEEPPAARRPATGRPAADEPASRELARRELARRELARRELARRELASHRPAADGPTAGGPAEPRAEVDRPATCDPSYLRVVPFVPDAGIPAHRLAHPRIADPFRAFPRRCNDLLDLMAQRNGAGVRRR